jgi:hypothetical protein
VNDFGQLDDFGVPANTFGPVPDSFYGAIGRIAMLGALVESRFADVAGAVLGVPEADIAGWTVARSAEKLKAAHARREEAGQPFAVALTTACEDAVAVMWRRNDMIHSLWPSPDVYGANGWRNVPAKQRGDDGTHYKWTGTDLDQLRQLITELVRVAGRLRDVVSETSSWPDPSLAAARTLVE